MVRHAIEPRRPRAGMRGRGRCVCVYIYILRARCPLTTRAAPQLFAVVPISAGRQGASALGFLGGAGINGGQNNADALFGSADDHDMYGIHARTHAPTHAPAHAPTHARARGRKRLFAPICGRDVLLCGVVHPAVRAWVRGIVHARDSPDARLARTPYCAPAPAARYARFGVSGPGWYGPGNGEEIGELWNPARRAPVGAPRASTFNLH